MSREEVFKFIKKIVILISFIPGILAWGAYRLLKLLGDGAVFSLFKSREVLAPLMATVSFTSLGFLLTITTLSLALPKNYETQQYKESYFLNYILALKLTTLNLVFVFVLSVLSLSNSSFVSFLMTFMLICMVNSIVGLLLTFYILFNLLKTQ